jgi:hypothetical protein
MAIFNSYVKLPEGNGGDVSVLCFLDFVGTWG